MQQRGAGEFRGVPEHLFQFFPANPKFIKSSSPLTAGSRMLSEWRWEALDRANPCIRRRTSVQRRRVRGEARPATPVLTARRGGLDRRRRPRFHGRFYCLHEFSQFLGAVVIVCGGASRLPHAPKSRFIRGEATNRGSRFFRAVWIGGYRKPEFRAK